LIQRHRVKEEAPELRLNVMPERIIILGASARAAAFSAARAGFAPWTADLFADADLQSRCPARRVDRFPAGLESAADEAPPGPWMYTGALENHPELVDRIAVRRPLWGNAGEALRRVRDPWAVQEALVAEGLPSPALRRDFAALPRGRWLRKPLRSAGGNRLQRIEVKSVKPGSSQPRSVAGVYYQEFIPGEPVSAVFVAARDRAILLGATRQLIGAAWTGARGFQYAGSIGPLSLTDEDRARWRRIGRCLARRFSLMGLFGVDAIAHADGTFPVEVNPRYTASIEILERSLGFASIAFHAAACRDGRLLPEPLDSAELVCGKAILYARCSGPAGQAFWRFVRECNDQCLWPHAADLPNEGEIFREGRPVLTLLAASNSEAELLADLQQRAEHVFRLLEA
jgi:predicted ATP-grasp superfamily ATP-dependent carboligase